MIKEIEERLKENCTSVLALFEESYSNVPGNTLKPIFNLKEIDNPKEGTYSLKKLYMKYYDDPTEISFIDGVLGGRFNTWEKCKSNLRLKESIKAIVAEAEARRLRDSLMAIASMATDEDSKMRFSALKYLCDNNFKNAVREPSPQRGRPSKAEKDAIVKNILQEDLVLNEALMRAQGNA